MGVFHSFGMSRERGFPVEFQHPWLGAACPHRRQLGGSLEKVT